MASRTSRFRSTQYDAARLPQCHPRRGVGWRPADRACGSDHAARTWSHRWCKRYVGPRVGNFRYGRTARHSARVHRRTAAWCAPRHTVFQQYQTAFYRISPATGHCRTARRFRHAPWFRLHERSRGLRSLPTFAPVDGRNADLHGQRLRHRWADARFRFHQRIVGGHRT